MTAGPTDSGREPLSCVVAKLGHLLERRTNRALRSHGLTAGQFTALAEIGAHPGISRAKLARALQITPTAVGGLTRHLLDKDLVTRTEPQPGLPVAFSLTRTGVQTLRRTVPTVEAIAVEMLRYVRPDIANVVDGALRHSLDKLSQDPRLTRI